LELCLFAAALKKAKPSRHPATWENVQFTTAFSSGVNFNEEKISQIQNVDKILYFFIRDREANRLKKSIENPLTML